MYWSRDKRFIPHGVSNDRTVLWLQSWLVGELISAAIQLLIAHYIELLHIQIQADLDFLCTDDLMA